MSAAHTRGPWLVNPINAQVDAPVDGAPICQLLWPTELRSEDTTEANARLIAAAPDLLAALQTLMGPIYGLEENLAAARKARAAINKATG